MGHHGKIAHVKVPQLGWRRLPGLGPPSPAWSDELSDDRLGPCPRSSPLTDRELPPFVVGPAPHSWSAAGSFVDSRWQGWAGAAVYWVWWPAGCTSRACPGHPQIWTPLIRPSDLTRMTPPVAALQRPPFAPAGAYPGPGGGAC